MTPQEIINGKVAIAEFMGLHVEDHDKDPKCYLNAFGTTILVRFWHEYTDDIGSLIKVVYKIGEYRLAFDHNSPVHNVCNSSIMIGIQYLFPLVVEAVNFINKNKKG